MRLSKIIKIWVKHFMYASNHISIVFHCESQKSVPFGQLVEHEIKHKDKPKLPWHAPRFLNQRAPGQKRREPADNALDENESQSEALSQLKGTDLAEIDLSDQISDIESDAESDEEACCETPAMSPRFECMPAAPDSPS